MDQVHTLRTQYGADLVTLIGEGYRDSGACGIAYLMSTVSTLLCQLRLQRRRPHLRGGQPVLRARDRSQPGAQSRRGQRQQHAVVFVRVRIPESVWPLPDADGVRRRGADTVPVQSDRSPTAAYRPAPRTRTTPARSTNTISTVAAFKATTGAARRHRPARTRCRRHRLPLPPPAGRVGVGHGAVRLQLADGQRRRRELGRPEHLGWFGQRRR